MQGKKLFDHEPHVQNYIIKEILINETGFLKSSHVFEKSNTCLYKHHYLDSIGTDKWPLKTLVQLLVILTERGYILPVTSKFSNSKTPYGESPYFIFKEDADIITDQEYEDLEYEDLQDAVKIIQN